MSAKSYVGDFCAALLFQPTVQYDTVLSSTVSYNVIITMLLHTTILATYVFPPNSLWERNATIIWWTIFRRLKLFKGHSPMKSLWARYKYRRHGRKRIMTIMWSKTLARIWGVSRAFTGLRTGTLNFLLRQLCEQHLIFVWDSSTL